MSRLYCLKLITSHYDSIVSDIDIYTEELLETIDPNDLIDENKIGKLEIKRETVSNVFEKYLTKVEPKYTPGVTKTVDYINSIRQEMIDRVNKCQQDTLDFYHENKKDFEIDPKQMDVDKEDELKRRLFGQTYCFVLNIESLKKFKKLIFFTNECLFNLYLIVCDHFVDEIAIDYMRTIFVESLREHFEPDRLRKLFIDCRILMINSLLDFIRDCLLNSLGHQHLIDIKLEHLLAINDFTLRVPVVDQSFQIELPPSSALAFTNLESLDITYDYVFNSLDYEFKSIGAFSNLKKLSLPKIKIHNESAFQNLINLRELSFSGSTFIYCELDFFKLMPNLEVFEFSHLDISSNGRITGFDKLAKLEKLKFGNSRVQELSSFVNTNVSNLCIQDLGELNDIGLAISNFPNLKHLELKYILLKDQIFDFDFKCESKLETLAFVCCEFKYFGLNLNSHKNLKKLEIFFIGEKKINPDVFEGLSQLEEFTLSELYSKDQYSKDEFQVMIKQTLKHFPNLQKLSLFRNSIEYLDPDVFIANPKLTHLDLSFNQLILKRGDFQYLSALKFLHLRKNEMKKLEDGVFMGLDNLEEIELGGNQLDEKSLKQLDQLKSLKKVKLQQD